MPTGNLGNVLDRMRVQLLCFLLAAAPFVSPMLLWSQDKQPKEIYVYPQKKRPESVDNYLFNLYYNSGKNAYNLRGLQMASGTAPIVRMRVNPSGTSFAILEKKKDGKSGLDIYSLWKSGKKLHSFKNISDISEIAYTPDARLLAYATPGKVTFVDARTFATDKEIPLANDLPVSLITFSKDAGVMAVANGNELDIYNVETKDHRKTLEFDAEITDVAYSNGNDLLAVLTGDGTLHFYNTAGYLTMGSIDGLGIATSLSFNPDDKYVSVVTGEGRIAVVNRMDDSDRDFVEDETGGMNYARFVKDNKGNVYLAYTTGKNITYKLMSALAPNFTKLLADELNDKMNDWLKMMPGESLAEYNLRVTEENRMAQMKLFEQEIATRMADNLVSMSDVTLGNYSPESNTLAINFDNMPPVYLTVPENELLSFTNGSDLEFRNAKYGLTPNDKFELIYAEVYNKKTGKTYTFDNLERQSLAYLMAKEKFVPLELMQQSGLEEIKLQDIKDNIIRLAKQQEKVSDHTHFNVNSKIVTDTDNNGEKVMNYQIDFSYEVDPGFSAQEDFAPGKYTAEESPAAKSMLDIIKTALESDFAQYVKPGKKLMVKITGMADAIPINGKIAYNGIYGDFYEEPVYENGELTAISVDKANGIRENDQLAFLRASGVKDFIKRDVRGLDKMDVDYKTYIDITEGKGGEFRRIKVELTFIDAFENK